MSLVETKTIQLYFDTFTHVYLVMLPKMT